MINSACLRISREKKPRERIRISQGVIVIQILKQYKYYGRIAHSPGKLGGRLPEVDRENCGNPRRIALFRGISKIGIRKGSIEPNRLTARSPRGFEQAQHEMVDRQLGSGHEHQGMKMEMEMMAMASLTNENTILDE